MITYQDTAQKKKSYDGPAIQVFRVALKLDESILWI